MSWRCSGVRDTARPLPPFNPPGRPRLVGFRFFAETVSSASPVAISTIILASWFGSRGRFMPPVCHGQSSPASPARFKLRHYRLFPAVAFRNEVENRRRGISGNSTNHETVQSSLGEQERKWADIHVQRQTDLPDQNRLEGSDPPLRYPLLPIP